eukprot:4729156-Amphidinium_carterae.2
MACGVAKNPITESKSDSGDKAPKIWPFIFVSCPSVYSVQHMQRMRIAKPAHKASTVLHSLMVCFIQAAFIVIGIPQADAVGLQWAALVAARRSRLAVRFRLSHSDGVGAGGSLCAKLALNWHIAVEVCDTPICFICLCGIDRLQRVLNGGVVVWRQSAKFVYDQTSSKRQTRRQGQGGQEASQKKKQTASARSASMAEEGWPTVQTPPHGNER